MKRLSLTRVAASLAAAAVLSLIPVGAASAADPPGFPTGPVTIEIWWHEYGPFTAYVKELIEAYKKVRPNVTINPVVTSSGDINQKLTVALAYPNSYSVGMASLALQILYRMFNARPDVVCERVFWDEAAVSAGQPLLSLESGRPVREFDIWAFTVSFEMDYFHVAAMLRLAGFADAPERYTG